MRIAVAIVAIETLKLVLQMMILVHSIDGTPAGINAEYITNMSAPGSTQNEKSQCLIVFANGHFMNTTETCHEVGELWRIEDAKEK